jgi:hypothetical protein
MTVPSIDIKAVMADRRASVLAVAEKAGWLAGERGAIGARTPKRLLEAAKLKSGLERTTDVVEYALAKVAIEDDFGPRLLTRKGRVPRDIDLDF